MFKLLVLLLLVNCVFTKAEVTSEKCNEMFEPHSENVFLCCESPQLDFGKCESVCLGQPKEKCSCANCLKENDLIPRDKDQYLKLYERSLNEEFTADEKENWLPEIAKSFEHCKPLIDIVNGTDECQSPNSYLPMMNCVWQQKFVNCPQSSFAPSEKCEATRKFLKEEDNCGTKYENIFVIDDSILDQFLYQLIRCKETFKGAELNTTLCVKVPDISPPIDVYFGCYQQCSWNECCIAPCQLNVTLSDDFGEEFVKDKIIEFYKKDCRYRGIDFDIWKPIIESSFGICYPLALKLTGTKKCNIRVKYDILRSCMPQELFFNAPKSLITDPDQCEKIKTFIANETKCGQKFGDKFIIDWLFWD